MDERDTATTLASHRYLAFISYSSSDREHALWLHGQLEAYRVPKHLASLVPEPPAVLTSLRPIFVDRLELAASADLPRSIQSALQDSRFLIVLCSPASRRSRWVNEEILTFKRLGRTDHILPLIVSGVPDARSRGGSSDDECFPPALVGSLDADGNLCATSQVEPLAADMRPEGDKRENAKLKLIAGLLGVGFDALVQREVRAERARARQARMVASRVQRSQSLFLANLSQRQTETGRTDLGIKLALEALPKSLAQPDRPLVHAAEDALYSAIVAHQVDLDLNAGRGTLQRVVLSPAGDRAMTVNDGQRVTLWDLNTGETVRSFDDVDDYIGDVAFSPGGDLAAIAVMHASATLTYAGTPVPPPVHIIDARSGETRTSFDMPDHKHSFVRFAPDGHTLFAASGDQAMFVRIAETCTPLFNTPFGARAVGADFDPQGGTAAIVTKGGHGLMVRFAPETPAKEVPLGAVKFVSLTFNRAGDMLLGLTQRGELLLFDAGSGALRDRSGRRGREQAVAARFSDDGAAVIVVTAAGTIESMSTARLDAFEPDVIATGPPVKRAHFDPQARTLVVGFDGPGAAWWHLADRSTRTLPLPAEASLVDAAFSSDGSRVLTATTDGHARVWSPDHGRRPYRLVGEAAQVGAAAVSADGARVAAGDEGGTVEMWEGTLGTRVWRREGAHAKAVACLAFHPQARSVASASLDGTARVWSAETGEPLAELVGHGKAVEFVSYSRDGNTIVTAGRDAETRLWEPDTGRCLETFRVPDQFLDPINPFNKNPHGALTEDGAYLVTVTAGDFMMIFQPGLIWSVRDRRLLRALRHEGSIRHISLVDGDRRVLTTSYDQTARIWDLGSGRLLRTFSGHEAAVRMGLVYAAGKLLVTVSPDSTGRIWDVESGRQIAVMPHGGEVAALSVALSSDERLLATSGSDGSVRIWDSRGGQLLCRLESGNSSPLVKGWFTDGDRRFVSRAEDGALRVWQLPPRGQALIDYARARIDRQGGAQLTREQRIRFFLESP
jgi:WD40 repeat protein